VNFISSCPDPLDWLSWLEAGRPETEQSEHLKTCRACAARVQAIESTADLQFTEVPALSHANTGSSYLGNYGLGDPRKADVWLSASSFTYSDTCGYTDLDRHMFVVMDETVCEAGRRWVDVLPLWLDTDLASDADLLLAPEWSTFNLPLRAQPQRQLMLAWEQLEAKVGEVIEDAFQLLMAGVKGEAPLEHRGVAYEGPADWRLEMDARVAALLERLREPYEEALAQAGQAVAAASASGDLGQLVELTAKWIDESDSHEYLLAAKARDVWKLLMLIDNEADRFEAQVKVNVATDRLHLSVRNVKRDWAERVKVLIEFEDGGVTEKVFDSTDADVYLDAAGHTTRQIAKAFVEPV
jgi:hypothetical protein